MKIEVSDETATTLSVAAAAFEAQMGTSSSSSSDSGDDIVVGGIADADNPTTPTTTPTTTKDILQNALSETLKVNLKSKFQHAGETLQGVTNAATASLELPLSWFTSVDSTDMAEVALALNTSTSYTEEGLKTFSADAKLNTDMLTEAFKTWAKEEGWEITADADLESFDLGSIKLDEKDNITAYLTALPGLELKLEIDAASKKATLTAIDTATGEATTLTTESATKEKPLSIESGKLVTVTKEEQTLESALRYDMYLEVVPTTTVTGDSFTTSYGGYTAFHLDIYMVDMNDATYYKLLYPISVSLLNDEDLGKIQSLITEVRGASQLVPTIYARVSHVLLNGVLSKQAKAI
jgi:hypothetical protein